MGMFSKQLSLEKAWLRSQFILMPEPYWAALLEKLIIYYGVYFYHCKVVHAYYQKIRNKTVGVKNFACNPATQK